MLKKIGTWVVVIALAFFLITDHSGAATFVHASLGLLKSAGDVLKNL